MSVAPRTPRTRPLNRLRLVLDPALTPANALDKACDAHPDRAIFHPDADSGFAALRGRAITPRQLLVFAGGLGELLRDGMGMRAGDRVAVIKTNHVDYFFLVLAIVRAGGVAVPINPGIRGERLERYLRHTGARIVLTDAPTFASCVGDPERMPSVERWGFPAAPAGFGASHVSIDSELPAAGAPAPPAPLRRVDPVVIAHTSGTTGFPKGVVSTSGTLAAGIKGHYVDEPVATGNRTGIAGHFNHLVYQSGLFATLLSSMPVWTLSPDDAAGALRAIERERLNFFFAFPDVYLRMYHEGLAGHDLRSMRLWVTTADASHDVHMRAFCRTGAYLRVLGVPLMRSAFIEVLGSTEVGSAALRRIRLPFARPRSDRPIGRRTPGGPRVRIAREDGRTVWRPGAVARVEVRGPAVFAGYWDEAAMRPAPRERAWAWTGDVGYRDRLGVFHHLDRAADVVDTRAGPVYTLPVEEVLLEHPAVGEVAVIGLPHPDGGELPVAVAHARPGATLDAGECLRWARTQLTLAAPLAEVVVVTPEEMPRGLTGKVLKRELRERYADRLAAPAGAAAGELADQAGAAAQE
ncbi:MAG TPA: class I adenylate-forming enzyme family protein [Thermoleophilaceae bacterium]